MQTSSLGRRCMSWLHCQWLRIRGFVAVLAIVRFSVLIPAVLALTLIVADQMIDLLRAVGEDKRGGSILWLLATTTCASLTVWYAARTMLRFRFASNPASDPSIHPRLKRWLPRLLGLAIPAALTIRVACLAHTSIQPQGLWYFTLALLAATGALGFYFFQRRRIAQRTGLRILAVDEHQETKDLRRWRDLPATTQRVFFTLLVLNFLVLALFTWDAFYRWGAPTTMGAPAILLLGLGLTTVSGSALVYMGNHYAVPIISLLAVWVTLCSIANDNHAVRETLQSNSHGWLTRPRIPPLRSLARSPLGDLTLARYFQQWWPALERDSPNGETPIPVFVVAAEGGGLRAAYWTAAAMAMLEDATAANPTPFSRHVFAISGVSGGSVGAAIFAASVARRARIVSGGPLRVDPDRIDEMESILGHDFLSDTLGSALFPDLFQRFLPAPILDDRAIALERSFERAWADAHPGEALQLTAPFHELWRANPHAVPLLFLNSTVVETGQRAINSPLATYSAAADPAFADTLPLGRLIGTDLPLSTAALLSARFTYVSPAGLINTHPEESRRPDLPTWMRLVDGGYFDNSGAVTAQELVRALQAAHDRYLLEHPGVGDRWPMKIIVLHLPNAPEVASKELDEAQRQSSDYEWLSELVAPVVSLLNTREARGTQAVSYLQHDPTVTLLSVRPCTVHVSAPLGWVLSREVRLEMRDQLKSCQGLGTNCAAARLRWVEDLVMSGAVTDAPALFEPTSCAAASLGKG